MKFLDEYRDAAAVRTLAAAITRATTRPWSLMEVCGGQTHSIVRFGLDQLLPPMLRLLHGPGCPVCVTPIEQIDAAITLARQPGVILCSFGDMLRVPGSAADLQAARSAGADVRVVYSPLDAVTIAAENPAQQVVFFAVGFETTAPANALAVVEARRRGLGNFSMLVSHVLVPPALEAILASPECQVDGFLAAGHVCTVMGTAAYGPIVARHRVPIVVTGFEPVDLLSGVLMLVEQLEAGRAELGNQYQRVVRSEGNRAAQALLDDVFEITDRTWRGIGPIAGSGWALRPAWSDFDAALRFAAALTPAPDAAPAPPSECQSGRVLLGLLSPPDCPAFGTRCSPEHPLGATMVSGDGACAAYHRYRRVEATP